MKILGPIDYNRKVKETCVFDALWSSSEEVEGVEREASPVAGKKVSIKAVAQFNVDPILWVALLLPMGLCQDLKWLLLGSGGDKK
jgi:hypothetical protein